MSEVPLACPDHARRELPSDQPDLLVSAASAPDDPRYWISFKQQLQACIHFDRRLIEVSAPSDWPAETTEHFLLDIVYPRAVAHELDLVLHAAGVVVSNRAVLIVGDSGRGKSTLVAAFQVAGHRVLSDDAILVRLYGEQPVVSGLYPSLRLYSDSLNAIFCETPRTSRVAHYTDKRRVSIPTNLPQRLGPVPLGAVIFLTGSERASGVELERVSAGKSCMALVKASFTLDPTIENVGSTKLANAAQVAANVPAFELSHPMDYGCLPEVYATIVERVE